MSEIEKAIEYFEDAVKESDEIIADCTEALQAELTEQKQHFVVALEIMRRTQPENKLLTLIFGNGDIGVSACYPVGESDYDELLLWNPHEQQCIGNSIEIPDGTTTDEVDAYARLIFNNGESAQVVVDALNRIIDAYAHKPEQEEK